MSRFGSHRHWQRWCSRREANLIAQGMPAGVASKFAALESLGRAQAAEIIGPAAAATAEILWREDGAGGVRFVLCGTRDQIEPAFRTTADDSGLLEPAD